MFPFLNFRNYKIKLSKKLVFYLYNIFIFKREIYHVLYEVMILSTKTKNTKNYSTT